LETDTSSHNRQWHQIVVEFDDYSLAENTAAAHLRPLLRRAETDHEVASWWFTRKAPYWRLRYLRPQSADTTDGIRHTLDDFRSAGIISRWIETIYEPEMPAFGGHEAIVVAHQLFHRDSCHILAYLSSDQDQRRELTILLCSVLMRAAGLDWYEQGDVWARVAEDRFMSPSTPTGRERKLEPGLHRLMTVDAGPGSSLTQHAGQLAHLTEWFDAFHLAGQALGTLAHRGTLSRGLRAVLSHHVIFHWNRIGLPYNTQAILANTAKNVILSD
jgi:thiopeptide-type bacteriocin biosynthesis protein